jgi:hypothetical protein
LRSDRVHLCQLRVQGGPAAFTRFGVDLRAQGGVCGRHGVQPGEQRLEVQHGAADQQRPPPARLDFADQARGVAHELGRAVGLQRVADVDQVVRHRRPLGRSRLGGADVHAAVHQGRIDADDFHRPALRNGQRRRSFA